MLMTMDDLPIYNDLVEQFDFSPEVINAKCKRLVTFVWPTPRPVTYSTPAPGIRPVRRKKAR